MVTLRIGMCSKLDAIDEEWFRTYALFGRPLIQVLSVAVYIPVMILYVSAVGEVVAVSAVVIYDFSLSAQLEQKNYNIR